MFLFENRNHFTLYYKNPKLKGHGIMDDFIIMNDSTCYVQEETKNLDLTMCSLLKTIRELSVMYSSQSFNEISQKIYMTLLNRIKDLKVYFCRLDNFI